MATDPDEMIDEEEMPEEEVEDLTEEEDEQPPEVNDQADDAGEDEIVIEVEGDDPSDDPLIDAPDDTPLQKKLRAELRTRAAREREKDNRIRQLEASVAPAKIEVGKKPDLWEDCDGDPDKFEAALTAYHQRVAANDRRNEEQERETRVQQERIEQERVTYKARATTLRVPDYQVAEDAVVAALPEPFQCAILKLENSAETVYALGHNPARIEKLTKLWNDDPVKALFALHDLSKGVKVTVTRKKPPEPETITRGSAPLAHASGDKVRERLEREAERTNDYSKLAAHVAREKAVKRSAK